MEAALDAVRRWLARTAIGNYKHLDAILTKALNDRLPYLGCIQQLPFVVDGSAHQIILVEGRLYLLEKRLAGAIEQVVSTSDGYRINGWAADVKANGPVKFLFASIGSVIVAKSIPTEERADIKRGVAAGADPAGFAMHIPVAGEKPNKETPIQVFAVMSDNSVAQLGSHFSAMTDDAFADAPFEPAFDVHGATSREPLNEVHGAEEHQ